MEAAGLAVGLAGLFIPCLNLYQIVERGAYLGEDWLILETKFKNQRMRFLAWGQACGLDPQNPTVEALGWSREVAAEVEFTLKCIEKLFQRHKKLLRKYGFFPDTKGSVSKAVALVPWNNASEIASSAAGLINGFRFDAADSTGPSSRRRSFRKAVQWTTSDDKKTFEDLVQHLKDFNDHLDFVANKLGVRERQQDLIRKEVENIRGINELDLMGTAHMGGRDPVADVARSQLYELECARPRTTQLGNTQDSADDKATPCKGPSDSDWDLINQLNSLLVPAPKDACYQVLHRVVCDGQLVATYLDQPSYQPGGSGTEQCMVVDRDDPFHDPVPLHLVGNWPVNNIDRYIEHNSHLEFCMFKDYLCDHNLSTERVVQCTSSRIRLLSAKLCKELKAMRGVSCENLPLWKALPDVERGIELCSPYPWFYYDRDRIQKILDKAKSADDTKSSDDTLMVATVPSMTASLRRFCESIEECMKATYDEVARSESSHKLFDRWHLLPLLFPPDNIVVERSSEGEPESQCFRQVGLAQIVPGRDEDGGEVLELGVAKDLSTSTAQKTLSISKAQFNAVFNTIDNAGLIENLPVYPIRHASTRELHHLFLRGWKMWLLSWGTHVVENTGDPEHEFNEYVISMDSYRRFVSERPLRRLGFDWNDLQSESEPVFDYVEPVVPGLSDSEQTYLQKADSEGDLNSDFTSFYGISKKGLDYLLVQPHVTYGFHLRDHVWKRLLVTPLTMLHKRPDPRLSALITPTAERILEPLKSQGRAVIAVQGRDKDQGLRAISQHTKKGLYRIRISAESEVPLAERIFEQAMNLAPPLRCIILIEDLVGAHVPQGSKGQKNITSAVTHALQFLDEFDGPVIFSLPHDSADLDYRLKSRICATLHFEPRVDEARIDRDNTSQNDRRALWEQYLGISNSEMPQSCRKEDDALTEIAEVSQHIDTLSQFILPPATIQSLARFATCTPRKKIDWSLLLDMARQKEQELVPGRDDDNDDDGKENATDASPPPSPPDVEPEPGRPASSSSSSTKPPRPKVLERMLGRSLKTPKAPPVLTGGAGKGV